MEFRQIVKDLRNEKGYNQTQFAKLLNKTQSTISDWENGRSEPSIDDLKTLSQFFNVSIDYLSGNTDEWGNPTTESAPAYLEKYKGLPSGKPMLQDTRIRTPKERDEKIQQLLNRASETDKEKILNALEIMTESTTARAEPATPTAPMGELPPEEKQR